MLESLSEKSNILRDATAVSQLAGNRTNYLVTEAAAAATAAPTTAEEEAAGTAERQSRAECAQSNIVSHLGQEQHVRRLRP